MPWIYHPATQDGPVSVYRWALYHFAQWLKAIGRKGQCLEDIALHGEIDEIPF